MEIFQEMDAEQIVLLLLGLVFFLSGFASAYRAYRLKKTGIETAAKVIEIKQVDRGRTSLTLQYETENGIMEVRTARASDTRNIEVGSAIKIRYNRNNPKKIDVVGRNESVYFILVGGIAIVVAFLI